MNIKKTHFSIGLLIFILSLAVVGTLNQGFTTQHIFETPKSSAGEITIVTPENKTYTQPDSGYFPATFGFENDEINTIPEGWIDFNQGGGGNPQNYIKVIESFQGHKKVLEGYDEGIHSWNLQHFFNNTYSSGTIEFWWAISSIAPSKSMQLALHDETNSLLGIRTENGKIQWASPPNSWTDISGLSISANDWDHVRIDFRGNAGSPYEGLGTNEYKIIYNGIEKGPFSFRSNGDPTWTLIYSEWASADVYGYYDALGFSWDPKYNIGDNLKEGLLLSYENTTSLDWQGYSLDGQANRTILGNTTIPMPSDGHHNIQVFGNDTMGTIYESDLRYFTVNTAPPEIRINSPSESEFFGTSAPSYDISITGLYDSIWYTLDGGITNYSSSSLTGTINHAAWTAKSDGIVTITFFANNFAGMEGSAQVMVVKDSSEEPPPGIPGYDLYLLLGVISVISALIIRKRLKS